MFKYLERNKMYFIYIPLVLYWIVLFVATTLPGNDVPSLGVSDKIEHFTAYMVLSVLLCFTYLFQKKFRLLSSRPFLMTILTVTVYGALDELHQLLVPGRSCDILDLTADVTGALLGLLLVFIIKQLTRKMAPQE
ncbi:MAG: VanZ family protein [Ignavibacteria bacterium]|nr:VanZ family protein [Ignavibacteria bacterium]HEX2962766.1 VanZ family protein [Ignavibacteriales bacterium]MCU7499773.1 VanZ family protein [Ignavibacteria bacterium]MCU7513156.1 VanZ family protein [Ignavibacteria bacterium]MCU7522044.1 VanZ family protein [Ignavibacteria bacterium]